MENSDLVVPTNSRIDDSPANESSRLQTSPPPPKCSPVSSISCLTPRLKKDDNESIQFDEIQHEKSPSGFVEEEKEVADILKRRLYDNAGTSEVYRSLRTQV
jgi:hypothetical protein